MYLLLALVLAVAAPRTDLEVRTIPRSPVQGTLFVVEVVPADGAVRAIAAEFAGEAVHLRRHDDGVFRAIAAVPIDAGDSLPLRLRVGAAGAAAPTRDVSIPIARGEYRMERLTVAPGFGRAPDAATAARIARDAERARAVSRHSHQTPRLWGGELVRPREGRVTSGFGNGREFNGQVQSRHMGTDFAGAVGAPVRAVARGRVALVDAFHLGGNVVYLDHGEGLVSGYLHLSRTDVSEGDLVEAGDVIGGVGATGRVTGPHLHWLVRFGGITVDPLSLLAVDPSVRDAAVSPPAR